jgi:hypothetical protein
MDDIHHKMKLHMNTKIMGLHTKLTNLVFNEIDRHLDRLNLTEESAPQNSPKSLQPGDWWLVTFDIPRLLIRCC